jgi:hypothetical protein
MSQKMSAKKGHNKNWDKTRKVWEIMRFLVLQFANAIRVVF